MVFDTGGLGGGPPRGKPPLHVLATALALVLAAVLGAAVGLVWDKLGFGEDGVAAEETTKDKTAPAEPGL